MQIMCPNCKKSYTINSKRLPPNITTAKCKVCGYLKKKRLQLCKNDFYYQLIGCKQNTDIPLPGPKAHGFAGGDFTEP